MKYIDCLYYIGYSYLCKANDSNCQKKVVFSVWKFNYLFKIVID